MSDTTTTSTVVLNNISPAQLVQLGMFLQGLGPDAPTVAEVRTSLTTAGLPVVVSGPDDATRAALWAKLDKPLLKLGLSGRPENAMRNLNFRYIGCILAYKKPYDDWHRTAPQREFFEPISNFGPKSFNEIRERLLAEGLDFGMDLMGWQPPEERNPPPG
jgi:hypothetical protein